MDTATRPLVEVIVNKRFEMEPFWEALTGSDFPAGALVESHTPPAPSYRMVQCRARYRFSKIDVLIRCIEDIMPPADSDILETSGSHSQQKAMLLPGYLRKDRPQLVISVSTAESTPTIQPPTSSRNGCVIVGGAFFTYDAHQFDPTSPSNLKAPFFQGNNVSSRVYSLFTTDMIHQAAKRFRTPPQSPAQPMSIRVDSHYVAVGIINVVNYSAYSKADPAAYQACLQQTGTKYAATLETTHGIVKKSAGDVPTLFVSPITDRYEHFADDVKGEQNAVAGYNGGVTVATLLQELDRHAETIF